MIKKLIIFVSVVVFCPKSLLLAQTYDELTGIFANTDPAGTARIHGMAGVQSSLGGDISLANSNPAGLGMANRSSFTFSGSLGSFRTNSQYYGISTPDVKSNLNIPQIGFVFHKEAERESGGYQGGSFAINMSRTNTFHTRTSYKGVPEASMIDFFLNYAEALNPSDFNDGGSEFNSLASLGWNSYLIDYLTDQDGNSSFNSLVLDFPMLQGETINLKGSQYNMNLAYGGNYDDMIFFGAGISLTSVKYKSSKSYYENFDTSSASYTVKSFSIEENLDVSGNGVNLNLGITVRASDNIQAGISYVSPTLYNINDKWKASIVTDWDGFYYDPISDYLYEITDETNQIFSDYRLTTPGRLTAGATFFFGKHGFVSADVEQVDYSKSKLRSSLFSMDYDNELIRQNYNRAYNIRVGGEFRKDIFRIRAGYGIKGNPYTNMTAPESVRTMAAGLGFHKGKSFADFAVSRSSHRSYYYPFLINGEGAHVTTNHNRINVMATFGFIF